MTPVVVLLLTPTLVAAGPLRLAATESAGPVEWTVDGVGVGSTAPGAALTLNVSAGDHTVTAGSASRLAWTALARPAPTGTTGAAWEPSWTATAPAQPRTQAPARDIAPLALGLAAAALVAVAARRRNKR